METPQIPQKKIKAINIFKKLFWNRYVLAISIFFIWMLFFDNASFLVINDLNKEIKRYEEQLDYHKNEFEKNDSFYKKLMNNKSEKEKFARENYFMKKDNEEIFILVVDSTALTKKTPKR